MVIVDERVPTDDVLVGEATIPAASCELFDDFEQQRVLASARAALFGRPLALKIGRYRVERRLGAGGMGEVYLAVDDALQRKVAVKRVLARDEDARERQRLRREAQALARLEHANVVSVYEVGEHQGRTFIAMQYVQGSTLAAWLAAEPRRWTAILERFVAAGRGLAAVHAAGLVHRDFKPDNVLIGDDGEVRVVDFGLALAGDERRVAGADALASAFATRLSATGAVMGTIRYMPLEQLRGAGVDARSDQFSFCVALYEALWASSPFELGSVLARLEALERDQPRAPGRGAPRGLWRVIRRGLSREPARRWPDMDSLLAALERVPRRRRTTAWTGAAAAVFGLGVAGALALGDRPEPPPDPCAGIERELAGIWDAERRSQLGRRFDALAAAQLAGSRERVFAGLDRWARSWTGERERVCRAQRSRSLAPELARLESECLLRQQQRARVLIELLVEADAAALARGVEAVAELPPPSACADELSLIGVEAPPADAAALVEQLRTSLARAHELRLLGRAAEARERLEQIDAQTRALDYAPLLAEYEAERAKLELVDGSLELGLAALRRAIDLAEISHHERFVVGLWIELALRELVEVGDVEAGARELARAEVALRRAKLDSPRLAARLRFAEAMLALGSDDRVGAEWRLREAIAAIEAEPAAATDLPAYLGELARVVERDDRDAALALRREALAASERGLGPAHRETANHLYALAVGLEARDGIAAAAPLYERAVTIWLADPERPPRDLAKAARTLAVFALRRGQLDAAEGHARALADAQARLLPPGHFELGDPSLLLASVAGIRGDDEAALAHCLAALAVWEPSLAASDSRLLQARSRAALHLAALGRLDEAERLYSQVVAHARPRLAIPAYEGLAELGLLRGRPEDAIAPLRAVDRLIREDPSALASEAFTHAFTWALVQLRLDREIDGRSLDERVATLAAARVDSPLTAAQLDAWFARLELSAAERRALGIR